MWARQLSSTVIYVGSSYDYGNAVATDANGVYLTGMTTGNLDDNSYQGFSDMILVKYDRDGQLLWTRTLGTQAGDEGLGLASDGLGSVYVAGYVDPGAPGPIGVTAKHRDPP
jgi:outer membrane protein assembly factor BamB